MDKEDFIERLWKADSVLEALHDKYKEPEDYGARAALRHKRDGILLAIDLAEQLL